MRFILTSTTLVSTILILMPAVAAQETGPQKKEPADATVVPLAFSSPRAVLASLDSKGVSATGEVKEFSPENLRDLVGTSSSIYEEYRVVSAASREYQNIRAEVFETKNQAAAFGLFTYFAGEPTPAAPAQQIGAGSYRSNDDLVFWKGNYFVRLVDLRAKHTAGRSPAESLARTIAEAIVPVTASVVRPALLESLPTASLVAGSQRYFLGPEALSISFDHARDIFEFQGDTEAVTAEYTQRETAAAHGPATAGGTADDAKAKSSLTLFIGEYHTPQFATDAIERAANYVQSLPESDRQSIIVKRTGNFIVAAFGVQDRELAESLVNSIEYPYTVKWLRNPLWPTDDPFRTQKAAEMLLSTFGFLGLILLTVLIGGTAFGTTIFLKRRKRQREIFSDAGGMLRLNIDQFESVILGLPPKRSEE